MDETYIKMCRTATEIQEAREPEYYDLVYVKDSDEVIGIDDRTWATNDWQESKIKEWPYLSLGRRTSKKSGLKSILLR